MLKAKDTLDLRKLEAIMTLRQLDEKRQNDKTTKLQNAKDKLRLYMKRGAFSYSALKKEDRNDNIEHRYIVSFFHKKII